MKKQLNRTNQRLSHPFSSNKIGLAIISVMIIACFLMFLPMATAQPTDYVAKYSFEGLAGPVVDDTGNFDGTAVGGVTRGVFGISGKAFSFNGVNNSVFLPFINVAGDFNFTYNAWVNLNGDLQAGGVGKVVAADGVASNKHASMRVEESLGDFLPTVITRNNGGTVASATGPISIVPREWVMLTFVANTTHNTLYVNGTFAASVAASGPITLSTMSIGAINFSGLSYFANATIDEVTIYDRHLNITEIQELYSSVSGDIFVTLNKPANGTSSITSNQNFNGTLFSESLNVSNATLFVWNASGDIFNNTEIIFLSNESNVNVSFNVSGFEIGDYEWNIFACTNTSLCSFANENFSLTIQEFSVIAENFNFDVFETDNETFDIQIQTIDTIVSISANLIYSGTAHLATTSCDAFGLCDITTIIDIPLVPDSIESQNKSFFWNITVFDSVNSISSTTTSHQQNVSKIHFQTCGGSFNVIALNFTAFDEEDSSRIDQFYIASDFSSWLGGGTVTRQSSLSDLSTTEKDICLFPAHREHRVDSFTEYNDVLNSTTYNTRNHFFQGEIINNQSRDVPLFLLNSDSSTSFILKVQDTNLLPITRALINIQRFNPGTGNFTTVQIARTDGTGQTIGFFKTETVNYRFIIVKEGVTLLTTIAGKVVPETAPFTLTFTVGEDEGAPWTRFEDLPDLDNSLTFNSTDNVVTFIYIDTSGDFSLARLLVVQQNMSGLSRTICDVNSILASGVLTCSVGNVSDTYTASGFITRGSEISLVAQIIFKIQSFSDIAGLLGVFLAWFVILISAFAFKFNEIAGIVLMNIAVISVNLMGFVDFGFLFIFGMLGVSIMIIVLLEK